MKVAYQATESAKFDIDVPNVEEAFKFVAYCDSVFKPTQCGNCGSPGPFRCVHRTPKGYDYFSLVCPACHHELKFGKGKESQKLFPKGWEAPYQRGGEAGDTETAPAQEPVAAQSSGLSSW